MEKLTLENCLNKQLHEMNLLDLKVCSNSEFNFDRYTDLYDLYENKLIKDNMYFYNMYKNELCKEKSFKYISGEFKFNRKNISHFYETDICVELQDRILIQEKEYIKEAEQFLNHINILYRNKLTINYIKHKNLYTYDICFGIFGKLK